MSSLTEPPLKKQKTTKLRIPSHRPNEHFDLLPPEIVQMIFDMLPPTHYTNILFALHLGHPEMVAERLGWTKIKKRETVVMRLLLNLYCRLCGSMSKKILMGSSIQRVCFCCIGHLSQRKWWICQDFGIQPCVVDNIRGWPVIATKATLRELYNQYNIDDPFWMEESRFFRVSAFTWFRFWNWDYTEVAPFIKRKLEYIPTRGRQRRLLMEVQQDCLDFINKYHLSDE
mgnify:CR=1 FL=1